MNDSEIKMTLSIAILTAKIKALKAALNEEQIIIYNESMAASKAKFLSLHENISPELRTLVDQSFLE